MTLDYETPLPPKNKVVKPEKKDYFADLDAIDFEIEEQKKLKMDLVRKIKELSQSIDQNTFAYKK